MKLSMLLSRYTGDPVDTAGLVRELESAGLDMVWVPEAYGFDAMSLVGYLAAITDRIQIGTGIVNVFSRTPTLLAMSAAGADSLSRGRFTLGLGASGRRSSRVSTACRSSSRCDGSQRPSRSAAACGGGRKP